MKQIPLDVFGTHPLVLEQKKFIHPFLTKKIKENKNLDTLRCSSVSLELPILLYSGPIVLQRHFKSQSIITQWSVFGNDKGHKENIGCVL